MINRHTSILIIVLLQFSFSGLWSQIQVSVDTIKMKWVENRCPTYPDGLKFNTPKQIIISDGGNGQYQWDYKWDQANYSTFLFSKSGGNGIVSDTILLNIVEWAMQGLNIVPSTNNVTLTFYEVGNPTNEKKLIFHVERISEYKVTDDYLPGYPLACSDTIFGDHGLYPQSICLQTDFTDPSNITKYIQGQSYTDQNFGSKVTVVSQPATLHAYAFPSPFSANSKYILVRHRDGNTYWDFVSPQGVNLYSNVNLGLPDFRMGFMWDGKNDEWLYYIQEKTKLYKYEVNTNTTTLLIDFSQAPYYFKDILGPWQKGAHEISRDNWMSFPVVDTVTTDLNGTHVKGKVVVLNLNSMQTYIANVDSSLGNLYFHSFLNTFMSRGKDKVTGLRYIVLVNAPAAAVFGLDSAAGTLKFLYRMPEQYYGDNASTINPMYDDNYGNFICDKTDACGGFGHGDMIEDDQGNQYMFTHGNTVCPYVNNYGAYLVRDSTHTRVPVEYGGSMREWWNAPFDHINGARNAPVFVSSQAGSLRDPKTSNSSSFSKLMYGQEVCVFAMVGGEIKQRRLAKTRSISFTEWKDINGNDSTNYAMSYFAEPHASISPDGKYVCWTSNQGNPNYADPVNGTRVFVAETGYDLAIGISKNNKIYTDINIFPNPASNVVTISIAKNETLLTVDIIDITGKILLKDKMMDKKTIDVSSLSKGIYIIKLSNEGYFEVKKFVVK